ncbi:MAG TPA: Hsp20/alpha crystallin family protein [Phycisphaerae bacterium]|nr:Hsp20/alpha crystallin family protein [Phycisphaerae bacterium]
MAWDPFRVLDRFLDRGSDGGCEAVAGGFDVDVREDEERYTIEANLPGMEKDAVEVTFEDGVLTIEAEARRDEERKEANFHLRERQVGRCSRSFRLPADADPEKVEAALANGVLTVTVAKAEAAKPRRIAVQTN